jgi:hypothetical protein
MLGLLPDQFQERAGKMLDKCRHISEYTAKHFHLLTGLISDYLQKKCSFFPRVIKKVENEFTNMIQPIDVKLLN